MKISKNIPIPISRFDYEAILQKLEIGDSFLMPETANRTSPFVTARRLGITVTVRQEGKRYRCWRINS